MYVESLHVEGFKKFGNLTRIGLKPDMSILVGNNDCGKSTILEALHLVLAGTYRGLSLNQALTQDLFNIESVCDYFDRLSRGETVEPPSITIEATFGGEDEQLKARFEGDFSVDKAKASGIGIRIELDRDEFGPDFDEYVKGGAAGALPIEYYRASRYIFARGKLVSSMLRFHSCLIDSSGNASVGNQQFYIAHLAKDVLDREEQISVLQAFRDARWASTNAMPSTLPTAYFQRR